MRAMSRQSCGPAVRKSGGGDLYRSHPFSDDERPPRSQARAGHRVSIPRRNIRPDRAVLVADHLAHRDGVAAAAGAETVGAGLAARQALPRRSFNSAPRW
jgi:hypothetical protein